MQNQRDTRLDLFRALALLTIFIDHVPGTFFERLTLRNFGFADAAEAFVLISGVAVGRAYAPKFRRGNWLLPTLKVWRRAGTLYCAHIMSTVATLTIFCGASILFHRPDLLRLNNIEALIDEPPEAFLGVGLLGHQLGYNNILSLYAVLLFMAPLAIWMLKRSIGWTLLASTALWFVAGVWQLVPPNYPTAGYWFLSPLSWQLLFVIGIAATMHAQERGKLPGSRMLTGLALAYLVFAFVFVRTPLWGQEGWFGLPHVLAGFDKAILPLPRLLDILALAWLLVSVPAISRLAKVGPDNPLAILGKHSLPVFMLGTVFAMAAQVVKTIYPASWLDDAGLVGTGIAAQFALAYGLEWVSRASRNVPPAGTQLALAKPLNS